MKAGPAKRQHGAAAIEFAAVFMIFFAVFYGLVSYSLPMLMLQSFNQASAEAVRRFLSRDGIALNRMSTISYGSDAPVAPNDTREGRSQNRRVAIVVLS